MRQQTLAAQTGFEKYEPARQLAVCRCRSRRASWPSRWKCLGRTVRHTPRQLNIHPSPLSAPALSPAPDKQRDARSEHDKHELGMSCSRAET
jgi:hypothetical protein